MAHLPILWWARLLCLNLPGCPYRCHASQLPDRHRLPSDRGLAAPEQVTTGCAHLFRGESEGPAGRDGRIGVWSGSVAVVLKEPDDVQCSPPVSVFSLFTEGEDVFAWDLKPPQNGAREGEWGLSGIPFTVLRTAILRSVTVLIRRSCQPFLPVVQRMPEHACVVQQQQRNHGYWTSNYILQPFAGLPCTARLTAKTRWARDIAKNILRLRRSYWSRVNENLLNLIKWCYVYK